MKRTRTISSASNCHKGVNNCSCRRGWFFLVDKPNEATGTDPTGQEWAMSHNQALERNKNLLFCSAFSYLIRPTPLWSDSIIVTQSRHFYQFFSIQFLGSGFYSLWEMLIKTIKLKIWGCLSNTMKQKLSFYISSGCSQSTCNLRATCMIKF